MTDEDQEVEYSFDIEDDGERFTDNSVTGQDFFVQRRIQLEEALDELFPDVMALFSELIQNSDDAKSEEMVLGFTNEGFYVANNGKSFNMGAIKDSYGNSVGGDLESINSIGGRLKSKIVDSATGAHGTGFELIYYLANEFQIHWHNLEGKETEEFKQASYRSNPEGLHSGKGKWIVAKKEDSWDMAPLFSGKQDATKRGVTFKAPWRTKETKEIIFSEKKPFMESTSFKTWNHASITQLFEDCNTYLPFMFQFCKNLKTVELYLILDENQKIKVTKINRDKSYANDNYSSQSTKNGCELIEIKIENYEYKSDKKIWGKGKEMNADSPGHEIIRLLKFKQEYKEKMALQDSSRVIEMLHAWGPVHKAQKMINGSYNEIDEGLIISCWMNEDDIQQLHNCQTDSKGEPSNCIPAQKCERRGNHIKWKQIKWPIVHLHLPLFDTTEYFGKFKEPNKTFISSIMPLCISTFNRFFVSGDFFVNQGRKNFSTHPIVASEWNKNVAGSTFILLKKMYSYIEKTLVEGDISRRKFGSINAIPEMFLSWFGVLPDLEDFIPGQNWKANEVLMLNNNSPMWNRKWVIDMNEELVSPKDIIVPTDETGKYCNSLAITLNELGLEVMSQQFWEILFGDSKLESLKLFKNKMSSHSPYHVSSDEHITSLIVTVLEEFDPTNYKKKIRTTIPIELAKLTEHLEEYFKDNETNPQTYIDQKQEFCSKSEFMIIPKEWDFAKKVFPKIRTPHPDIKSIVEAQEVNIKSALELFDKIEHDLENPKHLQLCVKFANKVLDSEEFPSEKRTTRFIPVQYCGRWILMPDNHVLVCEGCDTAFEWLDSTDGWGDERIGCCKGTGLKDLPLQGFHKDTILRSSIFEHTEEKIPEIISHHMFVAHKDILSRSIPHKANKRTAMLWCCSHKTSSTAPAQRTIFDHVLLKGMLSTFDNEATDDKVRNTLIELFELYAEQRSLTEPFRTHSDYEGKNLAICLFDENGEFHPQEEFIHNIEPKVRSLLQTESNQLRLLHPDIMAISSDKDFHWLANVNRKHGSTLKIRKNVDCEVIVNAIETLLEDYHQSNSTQKKTVLTKLSEIVMMILKSIDLKDKSSSLYAQINSNAELKSKFKDMEWVPIGKQTGISSELVKWSEFYLPTSEFDTMWGENREHPIIGDGNGGQFKSHSHFTDDNWNWLKSNADSIISDSGLRGCPSVNRMVFTLFHDGWEDDTVELEDIFSKELFKLLANELDDEIIEKITSQNPYFDWNIPTKEKFIINPTSYGKTEDHQIMASIFPIDKKSLVTDWIQPMKTLFVKMGIDNIDSLDASFSEYVQFCRTIGNQEVTEPQRKFITKLLKRVIVGNDKDDQKISNYIYDKKPSDSPEFILPGKDRVYKSESTIFYNKWDSISPFSDIIPELVLNSKKLGGIFGIEKANMLNEALDFYYWGNISSGEEINPQIDSFRSLVKGKEMEIQTAKDWNKMIIESTPFNYDGSIKMPLAILQGNTITLSSNEINANSDHYVYRMRRGKVLEMLKSTQVKLILFDYDIRNMGEGLSRLEKICPRIYTKITPKVVTQGEKKPILNFSEYMADIFTTLQHIMDTAEGHPLQEFEEKLSLITELSSFKGYTTGEKLQTKYTYKGKSTQVDSTNLFVCEGNEVTLMYNFDTTNTQAEQLLKIITKWFENQGYSKNDKFFVECEKQIKPLLEWEKSLEWPQHETKLGQLWTEQKPQCNGEMVLSPKKKEAIDEINSNYRDSGCNLCKKKTPNIPGGNYDFEEKRVAIVKKIGTRYTGLDNNTIGNMVYLCPNHAQSYSKRCVKIEISVDEDWGEIGESLVDHIKNRPTPEHIRFSVWEGRSVNSSFGTKSAKTPIDWNSYLFSDLIKGNRITKDHAKKIINQICSWIELEAND
jgi:hypothetical protein